MFLGYRVTRGGVSPGKKLLRRLRGTGPQALVRTVASYQGLVAFG